MYRIEVKVPGCKSLEQVSDFIRDNRIKLVLFAETHGYLAELPVQRRVIRTIRPDFFLYEMLEESKITSQRDAQRFLGRSDSADFSFISTYGDLKPTVRLARESGLPLIGCDIRNMCCTSKNWINEKFPKSHWDKVTKARETRQSKIINEYTKRGVVFASLGAYHLRKNSITLENLKENRFVLVHPFFNGKPRFLIPRDQSKFNVSFGIKLVRRVK